MSNRVKPGTSWRLAAMLVALVFFAGAAQAAEKQLSQLAPMFELTDGGADTVGLEDLRGKVVYLDFWASWCPPCRKSFPWMAEMQSKYAEQGLAVVAVGMDMDISLAREFLASQNVNFQIGYDQDGEVATAYKVRGLPMSFLINRDGKIVSSHAGFFLRETKNYEAAIQRLLR